MDCKNRFRREARFHTFPKRNAQSGNVTLCKKQPSSETITPSRHWCSKPAAFPQKLRKHLSAVAGSREPILDERRAWPRKMYPMKMLLPWRERVKIRESGEAVGVSRSSATSLAGGRRFARFPRLNGESWWLPQRLGSWNSESWGRNRARVRATITSERG